MCVAQSTDSVKKFQTGILCPNIFRIPQTITAICLRSSTIMSKRKPHEFQIAITIKRNKPLRTKCTRTSFNCAFSQYCTEAMCAHMRLQTHATISLRLHSECGHKLTRTHRNTETSTFSVLYGCVSLASAGCEGLTVTRAMHAAAAHATIIGAGGGIRVRNIRSTCHSSKLQH